MNIEICSNIAKLRKEYKMTQSQVAEYLGVSPQAVSKWEQEAAVPDVYLIPKIAFLFNVSIDTLFGNTNLDTTDLLVSKYSTIKNDRNYNEAKKSVDKLLDVDSEDLKTLGLLCKLQHERALEFLSKSKNACETLLKKADGKDENWTKRAKIQLMRYETMFGNSHFINDYKNKFKETKTVEDFNYLLIALGHNNQYHEMKSLGDNYISTFSEEDQLKIYPNLMEAALVLEDIEYAKLCFDKIIKENNELPQIFNAWWLLWELHKKLGNIEEVEICRKELLSQLKNQGYNSYRYESLKKQLEGHSEKTMSIL